MAESGIETTVNDMKTVLNIIWFIFGGFMLAAGYFLAGIIACVLVVTIPAGVASFRMASYALWPFGRSVVQPTRGTGSFSAIGNPSGSSSPAFGWRLATLLPLLAKQ